MKEKIIWAVMIIALVVFAKSANPFVMVLSACAVLVGAFIIAYRLDIETIKSEQK